MIMGSYNFIEDSDEEESRMEIRCPYCCDNGFDALELCDHLQHQHKLQLKSGVCPLCVTNPGRDMIIQYESVLKDLCKRKLVDDESYSIISQLRKILQEHSLSLHKESTSSTSSTNAVIDSLLVSFIYNPTQIQEPEVHSSTEPSSSKTLQEDVMLESGGAISSGSFSCNDHEERAQKSDFVHTLLLSTIFADNL